VVAEITSAGQAAPATPVQCSAGSHESPEPVRQTVVVGEMTFEFNKEGKYKASIALGSTTGTYSVSGNTVTLTPDSDKDKKSNISMNMSKWTIDGDKLRSQKDFKSDGEIVLTKTSSTEP